MNRRTFLKAATLAAAMPAFLERYHARAAPLRKKVKITDLKVMLVRGVSLQHPMVKIETDAGISGIGESYWGGGIKDMMLTYLRRALIGEDPLAIDRLYTKMVQQTGGAGSTGGVTVTAISGVEIALWDLAGKILDAPVYELLGGKHRNSVRAYWTAGPNVTSPQSIRKFVDELKTHPFGFTAIKTGFARKRDSNEPYSRHLSADDLTANAKGFAELRDVMGDGYEFAVHCHWEFDWPDALALARAVAPSKPWWLEDPMPPDYSESWTRLTAQSPTPILTGENLYTRHGFKPFIVNGGCHIIQIDIPKAGGLLESKKIADLADIFYMPVCAHNVASPLGAMASVHCAASIRDFKAHESAAISPEWSRMVIADGPLVKDGRFQLFEKPGLGVELNEDYVRTRLAPGEQWWG
ncbi:MAG: mandelate racemase/muconate lactonizing enzyme family protein [Candidatus Solibacter sp.]